MRAAVLSAHLDDAVLSASAVVATGARVITLFAGVPPERTLPGGWDLLTGGTDPAARVRARHREDDAALTGLAASAVRLSLLDLQHRGPDDDPDLTGSIARLAAELATIDHVYVPAALGAHPDHVSTRRIGFGAAALLGLPVTLYADVPYAVPYGWPEVVSGEADPPHLCRSARFAEVVAATGLEPVHWRLEPRCLSPAEAAAKRAALECYATQLPALDQGTAGMVTRPEVLHFEATWRWRCETRLPGLADAGPPVGRSC